MLYVVGGCSRSGKSLLAERMRARHGVPWFTLDALKMGLYLGAPPLGVIPSADDLATADLMWPVVEPILDHAVFDGRDYLVEGVNLRPATIAGCIADGDPPVRACFLGYPNVDLEEKAEAVARYAGPPRDWLHQTGAENVRRYLDVSRRLSCELRDECASVDIPFIDTGGDFDAALNAAESLLSKSLSARD
jgi:2-phosphoglycerate kinase